MQKDYPSTPPPRKSPINGRPSVAIPEHDPRVVPPDLSGSPKQP
jgi:hypothetical protein